MQLDYLLLRRIHNIALSEYKEKAKDRHETSEQFLARCWFEAFIIVLKGEGYDMAVVISDGAIPDGVESISVQKPELSGECTD